MHQEEFVSRYRPQWDELDEILTSLERKRLFGRLNSAKATDLPYLYRQVCNHYALARGRRYSPRLMDELHRLVMRGHQQLYTRRGAWLWQLVIFIATDFPRTLRANHRYFLLSLSLFLIPALVSGWLSYSSDYFVYSVLGDEQVASFESMYDPGNEKIGREEGRDAESDFVMFGYYIYNNIGIGFRTFALGILAGIGTVFTLVFNGLVIGAAAGHITSVGYGSTFWSFVSGHGSLELTAIVIAGAAGLMLGHGLLAPGQYSRLESIKYKGRKAIKLVMGAALMLLGAAFVEAFWSSSGYTAEIKYAVAALLWLFVIAYLSLAGKERRHGSR